MKNIKYKLFGIVILLTLVNCSEPKQNKENTAPNTIETSNKDKQLNITFLLDLSDRIEPSKYPSMPEHFERDQEIIKDFVEVFKEDMDSKGGYKAKGMMKVIFSPQPQNTDINKVASELNINLSQMKPQEKKVVYASLNDKFSGNLKKIYNSTLEQKNYIGSDIWRFFKNDVKDYAISPDKNYRNILVIITDGYIYHKDSSSKDNNRTTYLTPEFISEQNLRANDWRTKFEQGDYGFITTRKDLGDLEVLVLEVNPEGNSLKDDDIIKAYLEKWFKEMGIKKFEVYNSDLPVNTKSRISNFLKN